jgi:hypothetical protein
MELLKDILYLSSKLFTSFFAKLKFVGSKDNSLQIHRDWFINKFYPKSNEIFCFKVRT